MSTKEVLIRTYDLVAPPPTGSHHLHDVTSIADGLKEHEKRREERRVTQMRNAREKSRLLKEQEAAKAAAETGELSVAGDALPSGAEVHGEKRKQEDSEETSTKKPRINEPSKQDERDDDHFAPGRHNEPEIAWSSMVLTKPSPEMRGHTSYLTFATFYPASVRAEIAAQDEASRLSTGRGTPIVGSAESQLDEPVDP